ncbi:phosphogluconate dehydrogenase (NAD(+)-dependent, decarboxylating) [Vagococcus carniphilus]|uniref:phosphogluconate dehydrogenase (NAD(+)-dependent, decarboxylating) n=1 Tax=Vagococcus carniphilus TaxID=218144 RepID=UPI003BADA23E
MKIKIIGLGKMGLNLVSNLVANKHEVVCFDINDSQREAAKKLGATPTDTLDEFFALDTEQTINWLMLPSGKITEDMIKTCHEKLNAGDILIDGGNSKFADSVHHYHFLKEKDIHFLDVGTSGGMSGARDGACMMVGGEQAIFNQIEELFQDLCVEKGYLYCGEAGSGHYLKMVHNGIEYGMMQAIGEGFNLLHHSRFDYDLEQVARVFNNGSVVRSWLMELTEKALKENPTMSGISGQVPSSGEGKWTVEEMLEMQQSAPVITQSLLTRYASMDTEKYGEKVIASLRNQFGGHEIPKK